MSERIQAVERSGGGAVGPALTERDINRPEAAIHPVTFLALGRIENRAKSLRDHAVRIYRRAEGPTFRRALAAQVLDDLDVLRGAYRVVQRTTVTATRSGLIERGPGIEPNREEPVFLDSLDASDCVRENHVLRAYKRRLCLRDDLPVRVVHGGRNLAGERGVWDDLDTPFSAEAFMTSEDAPWEHATQAGFFTQGRDLMRTQGGRSVYVGEIKEVFTSSDPEQDADPDEAVWMNRKVRTHEHEAAPAPEEDAYKLSCVRRQAELETLDPDSYERAWATIVDEDVYWLTVLRRDLYTGERIVPETAGRERIVTERREEEGVVAVWPAF